jgi:hypothetical protein
MSEGTVVQYRADGRLSTGVLDLPFEDSDRSTFLLQLVDADSTLEGHRVFLGRNRNQIRSIPCKWPAA